MEENLLLNENAYIYKKPENFSLSKTKIKEIFRDATRGVNRVGRNLFEEEKKSYTLNNEIFTYSICIFKYTTKPTFIEDPIESWMEVKLAYLIIIDLKNYIVISKKNISGISDFIKQLEPIDYKVLSTIFINEDTHFEKFSLKNMNISDKAIRSKTMEALDLQDNFSTIGARSYILDNLRINTDNKKISLSLNTSRVNKFGTKNSLEEFIEWSKNLTVLIDNYEEQSNFLSVFAEPQSFENERSNLVPIAILFLFSKLYEDFENGRIKEFRFTYGDRVRTLDIFKYLEKFERLLQIRQEVEGESIRYFAVSSVTDDLEVKINMKSITLSSSKLGNVKMIMDNGSERRLLDYISMQNQFIVNFDHLELIYTNRKLFKDSRLVGNIDYFLDVFIPYSEIDTIVSEKGSFSPTITSFDNNSLFGFVETQFLNNYNYFICDDLGKEWADHIGLSEGKVSFYHSKCKETNFSASAFQDVVGQALKNLSSLSPADFQLESKRNIWKDFYRNGGVATLIPRLREGDSVDNAIDYFSETIKNPNLSREIFLVVNFISKSALESKLNDLRDAVAFPERNEVIQILWFISSFVSTCSEQGVKAYICCKP